jgi:hypothetical protein|tara:strand:+ start:424 stop:690 length:267 start_codon:yes stop_codon:yes gene_type:complete
MHLFDIVVLVSIACCVGFAPAIYVKKDLLLSIGYFVGSTIGAFSGGYLALWYFPQSGKPGILFSGLFGAVLLDLGWHFARKNKDRDHS